jgi:predicted nuclease of predicted toxin-antitoxin system
MRLYLDEDVHEDIAMALRLRGYDVKTTKEADNKGLTDIDQLRYASSEDRIIISCISPILTDFISNASKKGSDIVGLSLLRASDRNNY